VEIERQLDYIPGDDRDDGVQSRCCGLGAGRRANGDRFRLRECRSAGRSFPTYRAGERPFAYPRPASGSALDVGRDGDQKKNVLGGSGGEGGGEKPPRHPLIEGMFQSLPLNGQPWNLDEAADWLHAAAYNLRFAYKLKGKITIDMKVERPPE
jgi:hypothetical protein